MPADVIATPLPDCPDIEQAFAVSWPVRLGDTDGDDRLRLDAVARYLQDIGFDHLDAVADGDLHQAWIVRRTVIDVYEPIMFGDRVQLRRWADALSNRWCDMRIQLKGERGGHIEAAAFLIHIDPVAGRPARMSDAFMAPMLASTTEHRLRWRAALTELDDPEVEATSFPLRVTDVDRLGHVNNAVYWEAVEEALAAHPDRHQLPYRAIVEHVGPVMAGDKVVLRTSLRPGGLRVQLDVDGVARALGSVDRLPAR
ncbi:acyl-[acyl-carrier-protein] thioesterase [Nocardia neocaledoniensis NBRC 108232]|uniref:Acyl-ACP thioesterase n=1 Tax=Nocardia neocaledoniensis TaxID=236511 RepID=A0A317N6M7_9NOCA|nr:acyl-ACP thioesterase domain-containing protein [Nocardia neocaledoniensis]PWV70672.1 acyl-ACP thioesterase [Nocardia neocaledoniensis]GEM32328.1 acyl-[acyl-carrier-protein] thioesterase [Nocardia neocaledoniensis NBRC 108232]